MLRVAFTLLFLMVWLSAAAQESFEDMSPLETDTPLEVLGNETEISGLVLDRTITRMGQDFYGYFVSYWRTNYPESTDTFAILERPSARFGSQIWIEWRGQEYAKQFVGPMGSKGKELPEAVAQYIFREIQTRKLTEQLQDTFDMDRSEI